jgi:hypothetical protein
MMNSNKVLTELEGAIIRVSSDIKRKKGGSGVDKLDSLSKLVNSYSRLLERVKGHGSDPAEEGDPDHYRNISRGFIR